MVDLGMADALMQAVDAGTRLVLVGDVDQLPSVGPAPSSGTSSRQVASRAAARAHLPAGRGEPHRRRTRTGSTRASLPLAPRAGDERADFFVVDRAGPRAAAKTIVELVTTRIPRRFGLDPVRDVQVLTPMHRGRGGLDGPERRAAGRAQPGAGLR